jgi:uncharacterized protein (TIGR02594 family)
MSKIHQPNYRFLESEPGPRVITEAVKLYGTREIVGRQHSAEIMQWAKETGLASTYTADETPWCGLFAAVVVLRAGFQSVANPLWARNWSTFGTKQQRAMLGDVLVFTRPGGGGHVGFYVGEDATCYHVLGGNQSNMVNTTRILKSRCIAIRRCAWRTAQPPNVRVIQLAANGSVSTNEA